MVIVLVLSIPPLLILANHYSRKDGFLELIYFGQAFEQQSLPEIKEIDPPRNYEYGYDGQFYAQLAISPLLQDPHLEEALDNPEYRAQRIGLPALANILGLGKPVAVLQVYALLNFVFWIILLLVLIRMITVDTLRGPLILMAILWSTGTLTSLSRSLTDMPAVTLGLIAVTTNRKWLSSTLLLTCGSLIKETSILSFTAIPVDGIFKKSGFSKVVISGVIMSLACYLWYIYVQQNITAHNAVNLLGISWPIVGFLSKIATAIPDFKNAWSHESLPQNIFKLYEVLAPLSLFIQAIYLLIKVRIKDQIWRFGVGFVLLMLILSMAVWKEQFAYCRVLLPLTVSFNLLIYKFESGKSFYSWFVAGNIGLTMLLFEAFV